MMCAALIVVSCMGATGLFETLSVDLGSPDTGVLLCRGDSDQAADVLLLDGNHLEVHSFRRGGGRFRSIELEEGTTAFDVADLDGDGESEVIAVCGERIVLYPLSALGKARDLFRQATLLADGNGKPYPWILVTEHEGKAVLTLPLATHVALRTPDGVPVARYEIDPEATDPSFEAWVWDPPEAGAPDALELSAGSVIDLSQSVPEELGAAEPLVPAYRQATVSQVYDAVDQPHTAWPWFPLRTDGGIGRRVLYAKPEFDKTLVRIYEGPEDLEAPEGKGVEVSPPKLYPGGIVVTEEDLPDFNGDGYVDLVMRSAPEPKLSIGSITRAVTGGSWPLQVTMHLFSPEEGRYEARPFSRISCRIPPFWFVTMERGIPMRNCVLRDFNGDGLSDCGWCVAEDRFAVWLCKGPKGFGGKPDWEYRFPEEGVALEFAADLDGKGRTSVAFRGERTLYVFYSRGN